MGFCKECRKRKIDHIKRQLCKACYQKLRRRGELEKIPRHIQKAYTMRNMRKKYGVQFFKDLKATHTRHFWSFADVSDRYGLSRERVRQIHEYIYGFGGKIVLRIKKRERKESEVLVCPNDPRHKVADYPKDSLIYKGAYYEKKFMDACTERGFKVEIPCKQAVDLSVNGFLVDVKSSLTTSKTSESGSVKYHRFGITRKQRERADFFACYHGTQKCFFIIPNTEKGQKHRKMKNLYIAEHPTDYFASKNVHYEYKDAFYLLGFPKMDTDKDATARAAAVQRQPETADV